VTFALSARVIYDLPAHLTVLKTVDVKLGLTDGFANFVISLFALSGHQYCLVERQKRRNACFNIAMNS
jgi:hypothetical protein